MYNYKAKDIMTENVICINPEMTIYELDTVFIKYKINGTPVVDESGALVGVVSKSDIISYDLKKGMHASSISDINDYYRSTGIEPQQMKDDFKTTDTSNLIDTKVQDIMSTNVISANSDTSIHDLANTMWDKKIHRVVIIEGNRVVGMVNTLDILKVVGKTQDEKDEAKKKLDIALNAIEDLRKKM